VAPDPGAYVQRSARDTAAPLVTVTIVDMAGRVAHVTIPRSHTANGHDIDTLRAAVQRASIPRTII
jgi:hypothetical protein